jgi:pilus assembly protein FimV
MAFNKNKALESALKYLNQGKVAQAIGEYRQILRHDAKDQATLMTVGDLYARQGDMPNAIEYFERLAQVYLSDGFNSKAIAIYKKIAKLAPNELAPLERLADLYVQQGVLSEARPLYLQIAEAYLKANRAPKAVEVLHRLLEVEPESPRVQMRLAELYNVLGQKKEAAETYLTYAHRLLDRGEAAEAEKLAERAIAVDAANVAALTLKGKCLVALGKTNDAIAAFETHPEADAGGEITNLIIDLELKAGQIEKASDRARNQLLRGSSHWGLLYRVTASVIEGGEPSQALSLLAELRDPMIEVGEQEKFIRSLSAVAERMPGNPEPLERLADFCRTTGDPFHLSSTLTRLVDMYAASGDYQRAEGLMEELIDRNKDDERLVEKLTQLRSRSGNTAPAEPAAAPAALDFEEEEDEPKPKLAVPSAVEPESPPPLPEEALDDDTQKFIAQALTDVDLFSSYGLTQKATHLLETVLERAPRHTPTLERLLDFYLGAGNERRTAELASQLEQIYTQRGDTHNAERFGELRMRFQTAAGMTADELPAAPALPAQAAASASAAPVVEQKPQHVAPPSPAPSAASVQHNGPAEFEISLVPLEEEEQAAPPPASAGNEVSAVSAPLVHQPVQLDEEVDLSDEWEAMVNSSDQPAAEAVAAAPEATEEATGEAFVIEDEPEAAAAAPEISLAESTPEFVLESEPEPEPQSQSTPELEVAAAAPEELDPVVEPELEMAPEPAIEHALESAAEARAPAQPAAPAADDFEFELVQEPAASKTAQTTDDLINELVAELDHLNPPEAAQPQQAQPVASLAPGKPAQPLAQPAAAKTPPAVAPPATPPQAAPVPAVTAQALNQLSEVFQEFRNQFGEEDSGEDEDLETHYNLGIAYREMGLLDEAIGEFQKVAKAVQKGKAFAYSMNCSTLLAISFTDKGEPKIAALWYQRALETPGLDQEAILALRYDLAMSLEQAGESDKALDSFRQVYAMNIDYRDVADRIATLQRR